MMFGATFLVKEIKLDPLAFYIRGTGDFPSLVYEQICARKSALVVQSPAERGKTLGIFPAASSSTGVCQCAAES